MPLNANALIVVFHYCLDKGSVERLVSVLEPSLNYLFYLVVTAKMIAFKK